MASSRDHDEISRLVGRISAAWREACFEELSGCFHDDVVFVAPGLQPVARGKQVCVQSYEEFAREAVVREFRASEPDLQVWGDTAVVTSGWEMKYSMKDQDYDESGREVFVLARQDGRWRVVWRMIQS